MQDLFLRQHMEPEGWTSLELISQFPMVFPPCHFDLYKRYVACTERPAWIWMDWHGYRWTSSDCDGQVRRFKVSLPTLIEAHPRACGDYWSKQQVAVDGSELHGTALVIALNCHSCSCHNFCQVVSESTLFEIDKDAQKLRWRTCGHRNTVLFATRVRSKGWQMRVKGRSGRRHQ